MTFENSYVSKALATLHALMRFLQHMNGAYVFVQVAMETEKLAADSAFVRFFLEYGDIMYTCQHFSLFPLYCPYNIAL